MNRNRFRRIVLMSAGGATPPDVDALAFIAAEEAAGATFTAGQITAINNLFLDFKGEGPNNSTTDFWTTDKIKRYWPLVGASAAPNAIDVRLNTGVWAGGWTHSSNGAKGNATNTGFDTSLAFTGEASGNWGYGYYVDDYSSGEWINGVFGGGVSTSASRALSPGAGYYVRAASQISDAGDNLQGSRTSYRISGDVELCADSSFVSSLTVADGGDNSTPQCFGAVLISAFPGGIFAPVDIRFKSMYLTYGITRAEAILLQQIDNAFQTALGRNTY